MEQTGHSSVQAAATHSPTTTDSTRVPVSDGRAAGHPLPLETLCLGTLLSHTDLLTHPHTLLQRIRMSTVPGASKEID